MTVRVSVAEARSNLSRLLRHAREEPVIITRRGKPDAVILPFGEYEYLRRQRAYSSMVHLSCELQGLA